MLSFVKFNIMIDEYVNLHKNLLNKGVVDTGYLNAQDCLARGWKKSSVQVKWE